MTKLVMITLGVLITAILIMCIPILTTVGFVLGWNQGIIFILVMGCIGEFTALFFGLLRIVLKDI